MSMTGIMYIIIFACGFGGELRMPTQDITNIDTPIRIGVMKYGSRREMSGSQRNDTPADDPRSLAGLAGLAVADPGAVARGTGCGTAAA